MKRGDIVFVNDDYPNNRSSVQQLSRPYLIVSNNVGNLNSNICLGVPLTSKNKKIYQPTHFRLSYNNSILLCEQIRTLDQNHIEKIMFHIGENEMKEVEKCLKISLGMESA